MKIPSYPDYDITEDGVVTHIGTGVPCKHYVYNYKGHTYSRVTIKDTEGNAVCKSVLYLLAITYIDRPEGANVVQARDGDYRNTTVSNVMWVARSHISKEAWETGKMAHKRQRPKSFNEDSIAMVLDTLSVQENPITMSDLSGILEVPYCIIRYSMQELLKRGKAKRVTKGYIAAQ